MEISHLVTFNIALLVAIVSPGPAMLVMTQTTLKFGRRAGMAAGLGLGLMASTWTLMALFGLEAVFIAFPWAYAAIKICGAAYLIYIAFRMWRGARRAISMDVQPARSAFRQGIVINLLNPKSVLFAAAVLAVVFPADMTPLENFVVVTNHIVIEVGFYAILASGLSRADMRRRYLSAKPHIDRAAAAILGLIGLRLMFSRHGWEETKMEALC